VNLKEGTLRSEELAIFRMRALFKLYGYSRFKMSKFEEYDLYVRNKEFLVSDRMITFTDQNGTLLALKPDVTMSIIKTTSGNENAVRKLYHNENVFRAFKGDRAFREIMQTGLECIGDIGIYNICEVILLAVKSLELISPSYVLDISHLGFVSGLLDAAGVPEGERSGVLKCVREKNGPGAFRALHPDGRG
jgi:ATP phosphoribosyltransferase regulatory subunit